MRLSEVINNIINRCLNGNDIPWIGISILKNGEEIRITLKDERYIDTVRICIDNNTPEELRDKIFVDVIRIRKK